MNKLKYFIVAASPAYSLLLVVVSFEYERTTNKYLMIVITIDFDVPFVVQVHFYRILCRSSFHSMYAYRSKKLKAQRMTTIKTKI